MNMYDAHCPFILYYLIHLEVRSMFKKNFLSLVLWNLIVKPTCLKLDDSTRNYFPIILQLVLLHQKPKYLSQHFSHLELIDKKIAAQ